MKYLKKLSVFILVLALTISVIPLDNIFADSCISGNYCQSEARNVGDLINSFRKGSDAWYWNEDNTAKVYCNGLKPLQYDANLEKLAMQRAIELAISFSHTRPNGTSCFSVYDEYGVQASACGENIAAGYTTASSVHEAFREDDLPFNGQGHRRNMLEGCFNAVGVGCVVVNGRKYWAEEFAYLENITPCSGAINGSKTMMISGDVEVPNSCAINGLTQINGTWYYVQNGKLNKNYTGLCQYNGDWYYVENGVLNWNYTGLCQRYGTWYYIQRGKLNWNFTGLCLYKGTWYYVRKGVLNWNYTGLCQHNGNWYYVQKGVLNCNYTGLCQYNGNWYYIRKGMLDWNYTGLCQRNGTWYYVRKGMLNWNYTGLCLHKGTWYYVQKGVLNWNYTGLCQYNGNWYYVEKGVLNWNYTGLCQYNGNWYYVQKGMLNWKYTGTCPHNGNDYNVRNGVVVF